MAIQDIKNFLFSHTGVAAPQWKSLSKYKAPDGSEVRIFEDKLSGHIVETIEKNGVISIVEKKGTEKDNLKFCMILVKNPMFEEGVFYFPEFLTALIVDTPKKTTRESKQKLLNKTLKVYGCFNPGRLMNCMLPQIELIQIGKKSSSGADMSDKDREKIYNLLIQSGWKEDQSLAGEKNAKKWSLEQWAVTPMSSDSSVKVAKSHRISDHASEIEFFVWKPSQS